MFALLFLIGVSLALQLPALPNIHLLWLILPIAFCVVKFANHRHYFALPLGFLWVVMHASWILSSELPEELIKKDVFITGHISSLPDKNAFRTRFILEVDSLEYQGKTLPAPKRIRLNWYANVPEIHVGERWQLQVRLKPAHGMRNPGGFDYEKWLFERGIRATGYVRSSQYNQLLESQKLFEPNRIREAIKEKVHQFLPNENMRGLVLALAIGDRSEISDNQWTVLTATGTNHLVAISGLHIGIVAGATYFIFVFLIKRFRRLIIHVPAHKIAAVISLFAAFSYAMLAGFSIPTQRALVMTATVMIGIIINKRFSYFQIIGFALLLVLLLDPFSVLSAGFWLSFIAVGAILYAMRGRIKPKGIWWNWGRVQWIVALAISPFLLFTFQSFSLISPIANFVAVPWVSFVTVPLVLLGIVLSVIEPLGQFLLFLANQSLIGLWFVLEYFAEMRYSQWQHFAPQTWTFIPAIIGILLLLAPRGIPARYLSLIFLLPMFLVKPERPGFNEVRFNLLDVDQGLSIVVQTAKHLLVYDTGAKFPSGFNMGDAVVKPFIKQLALEKINVLMISHGDNDHIGGMQSVLDNFKVEQIYSGDIEKTPQSNAIACRAGQKWVWDGVSFEILSPDDHSNEYATENNRSCVLLVSTKKHRILITGDIELEVENLLLKNRPSKLPADILVAPHHGSNTSSSEAFIAAVDPKWVLFPVGFANRFNFPTQKVLTRYNKQGVQILNSSKTGAIGFKLDPNSDLIPKPYRLLNRRFWHYILLD